jgi:hypothetical protein
VIQADIRRLQQSPCLYPVGQHPGVRELPCAGGYRALYEVNPSRTSQPSAQVLACRIFNSCPAAKRMLRTSG